MKRTLSVLIAVMLAITLVPYAAFVTGVAATAHAGTADDPYSAADASNIGSALGSNEFTDNQVYVKGIVKSFTDKTTYLTNLWLIDTEDTSVEFLVYSVNFDNGISAISVGDTVVVYGYIKNYNGSTPEMAANTVDGTKIYPVFISVTEGEGGTDIPDDPDTEVKTTHAGTADDPYSAEDALAVAGNLASGEYTEGMVYVKGIVDTCSDAGTYIRDIHLIDNEGDSTYFTVYSANKTDEITSVEVGDTVVIYGYLTNYYGTPEMSNKTVDGVRVYPEFVSLTKGSGAEVLGDEPEHSGTEDDPYSATDALIVAGKLEADVFTESKVYVTGIVKAFVNRETYVQSLYLINEEGAKTAFLVYSANFTEDITSIAVGDKVTVCGYITNYKGNTPEMTNRIINEENNYPEFVPNTEAQTGKTLEEILAGKVGADSENAKFDIVIEKPAAFDENGETEVIVKVSNITVSGGLSQVSFVFNYDKSNLLILNTLDDEKVLDCVKAFPGTGWESLTKISFNESGVINSGIIYVNVLNAENNTAAVNNGDITLSFKFKVTGSAEAIGFYVSTASVSGYDWDNIKTVYEGNGSYAIAEKADSETYLLGDIDGDGKISARDYQLLKRAVLKTYNLDERQKLAGDIDGDGKISARDYQLLKRAVLGTYVIAK